MRRFRFSKELRKHNNATAAKKMGVRNATIDDWINHKCNPNAEDIVKIAIYTRMSADYLLGIDDRIRVDITDLPEEYRERVICLVETLIENYNKEVNCKNDKKK
ncbi:MAG: helix-turn-helix transcriptional regulator [Erysipelotrichaceae bacterium]|nr:helix-turn-helix transcriptional regulator [Erysipelotrichaceae bacterium]